MHKDIIKILLIEDNPGDTRLIEEMIKELDTPHFELASVERLDWGLRLLKENKFGVLLLDLNLPDSNGLDTLLKAQAEVPHIPIVVLTGLTDESLALEALKRGAQDYLVKGKVQSSPLARSVRYAIERKGAEHALQESERRFKDISENANEWIWEVDPNGKYTYSGPIVERILGFKPEEVLEKHFYDLYCPQEREKFKKVALEAFAKKQPFRNLENRSLHKNGKIIWLLTSGVPILDCKGNLLGYRGADIDITDRKRAEEILRISEERSRKLVESITDGVIIIDENFEVLAMNPSALSILKLGSSDSYPDTKTLQNTLNLNFMELKEMIEKGQSTFSKKEITIDSRSYDAMVSPIKVSARKFTRLVITLRDVTEERKLESIKSEFISIVSHELRTPLGSIKNAIDLLLSKRTGEINQMQDKFLSMASRNVNRLTRILNDFLDLAKMEAGKIELRFEKVNLGEIIEGTISTFALNAHQKSITLKKKITPDLPEIRGDPDRLAQVLANLVSNAIKYTPVGGEVIIEANSIKKSQAPLTDSLSLPCEYFVQVEVKDTGCGIQHEELCLVFDRFYQVERSLNRNVSGTGLGLPIVKKLVEAHGGKIWAKSQLNKGTSFIFVLPQLSESEVLDHFFAGFVNSAKLTSSSVSLVLLKIRHFEAIRSGMGAQLGRKIFNEMVEVVKKSVLKSSDYIQPDERTGRIFIILMGTPKKGAFTVCNRLKDSLLNQNFSFAGKRRGLEFFLGTANYPDDANNVKELRLIAEQTDHFPNLMVRPKIILLVEHQEHLAHELCGKLTKWGYEVLRALSGIEGIEKAKQTEPGLIILELFLPVMDGYEVMSKLRREKETKSIPILALSRRTEANTDRILAMGAGEFLTVPFSDIVLLETVKRLIKRKEKKHVHNTPGR